MCVLAIPRPRRSSPPLRALVATTAFGFRDGGRLGQTEVGQPWVVQGVLRTSEAVTPMPGLAVPLCVFTLLYVALAVIVIVLIRGMVGDPSCGTRRG